MYVHHLHTPMFHVIQAALELGVEKCRKSVIDDRFVRVARVTKPQQETSY